MADPNAHTATFFEQPAGSVPAVRKPVALVGASGAAASDDFYHLLRRRLLALAIFFASVNLFLTSVSLVRGPDAEVAHLSTYKQLFVENLRWFALIAVNFAAAWVLWQRPPRSLFGLRVAELVIVGPMVVVLLVLGVMAVPYDPLVEAADLPREQSEAYVGRYTNAGGLLWFFVITAYGTIIPNTLRRAAIVTMVIAVSPLVLFLVYSHWVRPLKPEVIGMVLIGLISSNVVAVVLVLVSTSRTEVLRRQASEARKLGQYVLKEKLGSGGMGEVYRAEHVLLRRPCALKIIRPEKAGDPDTFRRFEREVQTTATLTHPNTVQVFDYGHAADGTFYYVMEYLPGLTLEELVRRFGPLPPARAVLFLRQVCGALSEAHRRGLIHRDIKPGNVMVCERGGVHDVAKVLDFGLVHIPKEDADGGTLTREGVVAGTPTYMSPEQVGGEGGIDARSDLYSVGTLAYFLLTGQPPFGGRSAAKVLAAHLYETPASLPAEIPPDLAAVVMRCLAKAPDERWPDAPSLESAFAQTSVSIWTTDEARAWWSRASDAHETVRKERTETRS